jgi:hypothetical protein
MTEQPAESAAGTQENSGVPTPAFSGGSAAAPTSNGAFDVDALVGKVVEKLGPEIDKRFQSTKDKRFKTLDQLGNLAPLVEFRDYLERNQGNYDAALKDYRVDQVLAREGSPAALGGAAGADTSRVQQRTTELLNDAGISPTDPDYLALVAKTYAAPEDWYHAVSRFAVRRGKQTHVPGPESGDGGSGGRVPVSGDRDAKLDKLYGELRLAQQGTDRKDRERITKEIKALGGHA